MVWSPVVRVATKKAKYDPFGELIRLKAQIKKSYNLDLEIIVNEDFWTAIKQLREVAFQTSTAFNTSVMRVFQIETKLERHVATLRKRTQSKGKPSKRKAA